MKKILNVKSGLIATLALGAVMIGVPVANAAMTKDFVLTQTINAGTMSTDIVDSLGASVASPSYAMGAVNASYAQQTSTGTLGDGARRIFVDKPGTAETTWTLDLNGRTPGTTVWTNGTQTYKYNDASPANGQLSIDLSAATLTENVGSGATKGSNATFNSNTAITLMQASGAPFFWQGYLTGIGLSQTIPALQAPGSYTLEMTQTLTAS